MPTFFNLTLDTTAPAGAAFAVNADASYASVVSVVGNFSTIDVDTTGYQVKVWGDVEGAATEPEAIWASYATEFAFDLSAGDGPKAVSAKIRDDVGNETAVLTDSILLDTSLPVPVITVPFAPLKISKVVGWEISSGAFSVDSDIQAWEVKVVSSTDALHDAGTLIATDNGSSSTNGGVADSGDVALAADVNQPVMITGADLEAASAGDGAKIVKIFVQDISGHWSV